ncbi:MAG: GNAT family N-acetyltransferase [Alphaproteobacteria bacterium]|jgi:acetyltransferase|nr:GNAT family N-acetyltransferase [Alphaproteobacteria bacterium]
MDDERTITDREGRRYRLRPIRPDDADALQRAYDRMDLRDRRARLFAPIPALSDAFAEQFCTIDESREFCFVLESDDEPGELLGGCRLMGDAAARVGEYSVSLRSDLKGRGLGRRLMEILLAEADARGFETVYGIILADNAAMIALVRQLGFDVERDPDDWQLVRATRQRAA